MRPTIIYRGKYAPVELIGAPQPTGLLSYDDLSFEAWNVERPDQVVIAVGRNARQALDDAMIQLACASWKIRLRRALPPVEQPAFNARA